MRTLGSGELDIQPLGVALKAAPFPASGERGGPGVRIRVTNISPVPVRLSIRLIGVQSTLDDAVVVRASGAGAVLVDGPLRGAADWSLPTGVLSSGEATNLRIRFKLQKGLPDDRYRGRLDVRQLEARGIPLTAAETAADPASTTPVTTEVPAPTTATTPPATTPPATTPVETP